MHFQLSTRQTLTLLFILLASTLSAGAEGLEWRPKVFMDNEIFPSYLVAVANAGPSRSDSPYVLGNTNGVVGAYVNSPARNSKAVLSVKIDGVANEQAFEFSLPEGNCTYLLMPNLVWEWDALRKSRQTRPANCRFTYSVNGSPAEQVTQVVDHPSTAPPRSVLAQVEAAK